jgi:hypothetical protein
MEFDDAQQPEEQSEPARRTRPRTVHVARTWLAVLTAFITELAIIGATNNERMTDWVNRKVGAGQSLVDHLARASQVFHWRFNYHHVAPFSSAGDFARIGALIVLTALLLIPIIRGSVTFVRAFFGTWFAVVVATVLAQFAGAAPKPNFADPAVQHPATRLFDSYLAPSASGVAAGIALGFVVALLTAGVAVGTRRRLGTVQPVPVDEAEIEELPYEPPAAPPPWNPPADEPPMWTPAPSYQQPAWSRESAETLETERVEPVEHVEPARAPAVATTTPWPPAAEASAPADVGHDEDEVRIDEDEEELSRR